MQLSLGENERCAALQLPGKRTHTDLLSQGIVNWDVERVTDFKERLFVHDSCRFLVINLECLSNVVSAGMIFHLLLDSVY